MKRNIFSKWTLPSKIFNFPAAVFPLVRLIAAYREPAPDIIMVVALVLAWTLFFLWVNSRLKFVSVDENNLEVFLTTIGFMWVGVRFKSKTELFPAISSDCRGVEKPGERQSFAIVRLEN
ncbi:MAG TPA: hypothetical protein VGC76_10205 [Pyrinomonadaceae bacterium]|jgi:hypothetical protein